MKPLNRNGLVLYETPDIVALATGLKTPSANAKTGPMIQVTIAPRNVSPTDAVKSGEDELVCFSCPLRGVLGKGRACYVQLGKSVLKTWQAYAAGRYPVWDGKRSPFARASVRLGAWGDPAALPLDLCRDLLSGTRSHTAYTHAWRTCDAGFANIAMASTDTLAERGEALAAGYRFYGLGEPDADSIACPYPQTTCERCGLCNGHRRSVRASITQRVHGMRAAFAPDPEG